MVPKITKEGGSIHKYTCRVAVLMAQGLTLWLPTNAVRVRSPISVLEMDGWCAHQVDQVGGGAAAGVRGLSFGDTPVYPLDKTTYTLPSVTTNEIFEKSL